MKAVEYKHSWEVGTTEEDEMVAKFGTLLADYDTSESYETERSLLFKKGTKYVWLGANGCSCWEGDYDGWELTKAELLKLANKNMEHARDWRDAADDLLAKWIIKNIK